VLCFHGFRRDREPGGKAPEEAATRNGENREILVYGNEVFLPEASGEKIAGTQRVSV